MKYLPILSLLSILFITACQTEEPLADAYGNFEARTTLISAEARGRLLTLDIEEGQKLEAGRLIALVDTTSLHLQRLQLEASLKTLPKKLRESAPEIAVLEDQKQNLLREQTRVQKLLEDKAATPKQLDDLNGELAVLDQRIEAVRRQAQIANRGILAEKDPIAAKILSVEDQIQRCYIKNPVGGTVLTKLAEQSEIVNFGSPLYKIANLDHLTLRAYVSGRQLSQIYLGQTVSVRIDGGQEFQEMSGEITWIAEQAEFTPKIIQTREERVNLVYAFKIKVKNDGRLKLGMPAEVIFLGPHADSKVPESAGS
ncbi:MAG: HlyD family efflux transporter periplasmic adaptor subunit [Bacteroidota bacterium]